MPGPPRSRAAGRGTGVDDKGLIACTIAPDIQPFLISGHKSVEKAQKAALAHMGIDPLIDFNMRLGEGTGAALAIDTADAACKLMCEMASFDEARIANKTISLETSRK